jgi:hypothetical protein
MTYPPEPTDHRHHDGHLAREIRVTIYYEAAEHRHPFTRSATVEDVLIWAIAAFNIDPSMATEFELTRHGQKEELPGAERVGHLAGRHRELALDLVRGDIANGGYI